MFRTGSSLKLHGVKPGNVEFKVEAKSCGLSTTFFCIGCELRDDNGNYTGSQDMTFFTDSIGDARQLLINLIDAIDSAGKDND